MLQRASILRLSRRRLLGGTAVLAAAAVLQACSSSAPASPTAAPAATTAPTATAASQPTAAATTAPVSAAATPAATTVATSGASATATTAPAAQSSPSAPAQATIAMWMQEAPFLVFWKNRAKEFADLHPSTKFDWQILQVPFNQLSSKLIGMATTQQGAPNLVATEYRWFPNLLKGDKVTRVLVDLLPFMQQDQIDPNQFVKKSLYTWKGKLYGLETNAVVSAYFFRKDIFDEAGVSVSYEPGGKAPFDTYDDFITAGKALKAKGHYLMGVDSGDLWTNWQTHALQAGGQLFDDKGTLVIDSPANTQCLTLVKRMLDEGVAKLTSNQDYWGAAQYAAYKSGAVLGACMPDWYEENFIEASDKDTSGKWMAVPLPAYQSNGNRATVWGGTGIGITTQSTNRDLSWQFLSYGYCNQKNQVQRYLEVDYFPTYKPAWQDPKVLAVANPFYNGETIGTLYAQLAPGLPEFYTNPYLNEAADKFLSEAWTPVMTGKKTISQGLKDAQAAATTVINAGV
jgi:arabinosaccharide transport system substrate-binding protein